MVYVALIVRLIVPKVAETWQRKTKLTPLLGGEAIKGTLFESANLLILPLLLAPKPPNKQAGKKNRYEKY
ncbi:MAG: hypothetical protein Q8O03_01055 [Nanoarchaeota archaeon]|nr:hypothetical protein [Nanoarchaeota archaeon]